MGCYTKENNDIDRLTSWISCTSHPCKLYKQKRAWEVEMKKKFGRYYLKEKEKKEEEERLGGGG